MQEPPTFQDAADVEKAALAADKSGEFCFGLPGSVAPIEKFDPFNFLQGKTYEQVRTWREAELAHCRVGMLAAAGFLVQEKFHPLFNADGGPAIEQIPKLPVVMWPIIAIGIGGCEALRISYGWADPSEPNHVFQKLKPNCTRSPRVRIEPTPRYPSRPLDIRPPLAPPPAAVSCLGPTRRADHGRASPRISRADVPGDIGFDPLGLKPTDPAEFKEMQTKELQNGRLAMLAAAGFLAQEAVTGETWGSYWGIPDF